MAESDAVSAVSDDDSTAELTRVITERLKGVIEASAISIDCHLEKRRRKWRKRSSKHLSKSSPRAKLYKPVDGALLEEKEEVLDEFEARVESLLETRKSCTRSAIQLEEDRLQEGLNALNVRVNHLRNDMALLAHSPSSDSTEKGECYQDLLLSKEIVTEAIKQAKSLQFIKSMKHSTSLNHHETAYKLAPQSSKRTSQDTIPQAVSDPDGVPVVGNCVEVLDITEVENNVHHSVMDNNSELNIEDNGLTKVLENCRQHKADIFKLKGVIIVGRM